MEKALTKKVPTHQACRRAVSGAGAGALVCRWGVQLGRPPWSLVRGPCAPRAPACAPLLCLLFVFPCVSEQLTCSPPARRIIAAAAGPCSRKASGRVPARHAGMRAPEPPPHHLLPAFSHSSLASEPQLHRGDTGGAGAGREARGPATDSDSERHALRWRSAPAAHAPGALPLRPAMQIGSGRSADYRLIDFE